jgi:hypothetical protein
MFWSFRVNKAKSERLGVKACFFAFYLLPCALINSAFTSGDLQALCLVLLKAYNDFFEKLAKVAL